MIYVALDVSMCVWRVVSFIEEHNHKMIFPSKRQFLLVNHGGLEMSFKESDFSNMRLND